jgi:hypothetical protein
LPVEISIWSAKEDLHELISSQKTGDVHRYVENGALTTCKIIAEIVVMHSKMLINQNGVGF